MQWVYWRYGLVPGRLLCVSLADTIRLYLQAFARFDITLIILALERVSSLVASIKACKLVPLPDIITVIRTVSLDDSEEELAIISNCAKEKHSKSQPAKDETVK